MLYIKLKYLRERENLTREQLAKELSISYSTLSKYETNERQPDLTTLKNIASYFKVSTDYLLDNPFSHDQIMNDVVVYFELIKDIVKSQDDVCFKGINLSATTREFIHDSLEYVARQIVRIDGD